MASEASQTMSLKILVEKEKNQIVFVEANKDFVDVLFSFHTIPIGTFFGLTREHFLEGEIGCLNDLYESLEKLDEDFLSSEQKGILLHPRCATDIYCRNLKGNLGNLRKSVQDLDVNKFFKSEEMKAILLDPKLAPGTSYDNKLIESPLREVKIGGELVKGPSMFMVTDSLSIAPLSPIPGISLINRLKIPLSDIQELEVNMGEEEALRLLVAALVSRSALTDAFVRKEMKQET